LLLGFLSVEVNDGLVKVLLDLEHQVLDLLDGIGVSELVGGQLNQSLEEGGINGFVEFLLDLLEGDLSLLDLDQGSGTFTTIGVEGGQ